MCTPTAFIGLALSTVSTLAQASATNRAAEQQYAIAEQQYALNERNRLLNEEALVDRRTQLTEDAANESAALARESAQVRARQLVANAESGGGGNTAAALLRDIGFQTGLQQVSIDTQFGRERDQIGRQLTANNQNARTANLNNQAMVSSVQTASPLQTGLAIGGAALGAASKGGMFSNTTSRLNSSWKISPRVLNGDT